MAIYEREYAKLNEPQKAAVDTIDGPLLVIAGPGTGKTQLLSLRVANILHKTDVHPHNILCLTYTESGQQAMVARLTEFLDKAAKQVEVHTFHGFGTRLINRFPEYFPELMRFRPADDLTLYETLQACLERLPRNNPLSKQAYGEFTYLADARERISQLKKAGITPEQALNLAEADLKWSKSQGQRLVQTFNQAGRISTKAASIVADKLKSVTDQAVNSELGQACLDELRLALKELDETGSTKSLSSYKKKWFTSEDGSLYFKPTDQLKKMVALAELYEAYESELKKRNLFDYDDMILYALEKLKNSADFLASVQETFHYILADEYQDTNAAQASIINLIADNPVHEGRPNVMVVGDDDQAIYGFQGALGDVLMDFRERWRDVKVVTLKDNYRSTASILSTARSIITQGQNRLENYYNDIDKSLTNRTDYPDIKPFQVEAASPEAVLDKAVRVAVSSTADKQLAIIATKHKYLRDLADRLDAAKVSYYYEGREDLLKDPGIDKLLQLTNLCLSIKQKEFTRTNFSLPEIIATKLLPIERHSVWQVALTARTQHISWWEALLLQSDAEVKLATQTLSHIAKSLEPKDALGSLKTVAKQYHLRVLKKIERLVKHAQAYYGHEDISLTELLRYTDLCKQAGVTLEQTIVKGSKQASVVLLSAHRSKGLEFDRVYILHADYQTWFKEGGRRNNLVLPESWKSIEPLATNQDDRLRLLYVVMTRAKQELALIKTGQADNFPGLDNLKVEQHMSEQLEAYTLPVEQVWRSWFLPKSDRERLELKRLLEPILNTYHISPSHLTMFLDVTHGGPVTFFTKVLLGIPEPVHPEAIFGNHVHKTLHFAQDYLNQTGKLPTRAKLESFISAEITNISKARMTDIVSVVDDFLQQSHILVPGGAGEYSFSGKNINMAGIRLTGTVDHFKLTDDSLTVTDFKTGRALNSWRVSEPYYKQKLHRFRQQLMFYELLFKLSPDFSSVTKVTSKVAFVEPSRRDVYYELTLDAEMNERQQLELLVQAIWQKVMQLEIPEVSVYSLDMSGITAFEEDLISEVKITKKRHPKVAPLSSLT